MHGKNMLDLHHFIFGLKCYIANTKKNLKFYSLISMQAFKNMPYFQGLTRAKVNYHMIEYVLCVATGNEHK